MSHNDSPTEGYIESPDEFTPSADQVFCFKDSARPCDSDCVAYLTTRPEGADYESQTFSQCLLLVNSHRTGKHLTVLASQGSALLKHLRVKTADSVRAAGNPISSPKVG